MRTVSTSTQAQTRTEREARPPLAGLLGRLARDPGMAALVDAAQPAVAVAEAGVPLVLGALAQLGGRRPLLVVTPTQADAERVAHDLRAFLPAAEVELFPAWDTLPFERVSPESWAMAQRLRVLWRLQGHPAAAAGPVTVVVAPVRAVLQRLGVLEETTAPVRVALGSSMGRDELVARLVALGYRREYQVEHRGEVAVRGSIVDVFPPDGEDAVRIDFFGDEVDRLAVLDPGDQRSGEALSEVLLVGCREVLPTPAVAERAARLLEEQPWAAAQWRRLADGEVFDGMEAFWPWLDEEARLLPDLLPAEARVVLVDPRRARDRAEELVADEAALVGALADTWGFPGSADDVPRLHLGFDRLLARCPAPVVALPPVPDGPATPEVGVRGWSLAGVERAALASRLGRLAAEGNTVVVCGEGAGAAARMAEHLRAEGLEVRDATGGLEDLPGGGAVVVTVASLDHGVLAPGAGLAVVAEADVSGRRRPHRRARARSRPAEGFFDDLSPGDYVVHRQHGVGRFAGMVTREVGGAARDYLLLEYRDGDKLYLPSDQIGMLTPYSGGEAPTLHRLGGSDWQRTRARAQAAVRKLSEELVALYRARLTATGHAFAPDTPWQRELEDAFGYLETPDQLAAVEAVKRDMEQPRPMDRLVCGDVGFGKTEVALRAVFKAVQDGKQAAVLVPTTLLAQQHHQTFSTRFAPYPVRVEVLSRFLTPAEQREVVAGLADGSVDVVIGTHRLLAADVRFKDLGLLVVDEEQRFGVQHKEAVKRLATGVDVLTLTASPIPRTLEMALTGIRDLSLIQTPPAERQPILTYVGEYDEAAVVEAIRRELLREGQVFFVHNWVADIEQVAARIRQLVPEARVGVAHGQMDEGALEQVVLDFWERRLDVLVCTTIIESGIDMPTVNTLVVDRADRLGLGQLHQLRGRVGRSGQRAYAYLFHPPDRVLPETAYERLRTIGEHTELGSGFKIAMRDLEIRGAGNLLGEDQSGHVAAVGYDLYVQMVAEAVAEARGEPIRPPAEVSIDVPSVAFLPADYVAREDLRLEAYRRLAAVADPESVEEIRAEWLDRFGPLPPPAEGLLAVARLRAECVRVGIHEVTVTASGGVVGPGGKRRQVARLAPLALPASAKVRLARLHPRAVYKEDLGQLILPVPPEERDAADWLTGVLRQLVPPPAAQAAPGSMSAP
ncbi:transcription-repair coupling factor [Aciditerrimonas ferrireducens]|uniref:transcription-repair coupling factor n=1 Tax=Aciditerrimonas ferrireducens TaxID=667306 RepID=UPI0020033ECE|nr:transcription-repair coupling factor [Aciditerrimonas ferrireducens]MCK4176386.1 transcription-repair coupling factor [Aciditerrimonas ferrireducens]